MGYVAGYTSSRRRNPPPRGVLNRAPARQSRSRRRGRALGFFGLDSLITWGGGQLVDRIAGGAEGGDEKAQRALTAGAAQQGPYTESQTLAAIRKLGASDHLVQELRRRTLIKDWLQGIGIESNDGALARAAVFLAHGGQDGRPGATEASVAEALRAVLQRAGAQAMPQPQYATYQPDYLDAARRAAGGAVDALQDRYLSPEQRGAGAVGEFMRAPTESRFFLPALAAAAFFLLKR